LNTICVVVTLVTTAVTPPSDTVTPLTVVGKPLPETVTAEPWIPEAGEKLEMRGVPRGGLVLVADWSHQSTAAGPHPAMTACRMSALQLLWPTEPGPRSEAPDA
jgi:hypothetical protein